MRTVFEATALAAAAALSGCVCTCVTAGAEWEAVCAAQGGRVQAQATSRLCVADAGVIATWVVDDSDGGD